MTSNTICTNQTCPHNTGKNCIAAEECQDFTPADCTKCLWEDGCNWNPEECHFVLNTMEEDNDRGTEGKSQAGRP